MKIYPLSEGSFTIDQSKVFLPFNTQTDDLQKRSRGSLLVEIQPFLLQTDQDLILFDSGLGYSKNGVLQIVENLASCGFTPFDVTTVLMSHLHRDHAGGLIIHDTYTQKPYLTFPHAQHHINRSELECALSGTSASYDPLYFSFLANHDKIKLIDGDGYINDHIRYQRSSGHSPFHQVFWVTEKQQTVFFGGDEAPQLQQLKTKFIAKYDTDGKKAMELRQKWWADAAEEHWTFLFYHDIRSPYITL